MQRRTFVVGMAAGTGSLSLAGCSGTDDADLEAEANEGDGSSGDETTSSEDASDDEPSEENTPDDTDEVAEPDPIALGSDGSATTDPFDLIGGFTVADIEYAGYDGTFQVRLIDDDSGDLIRELADETQEWSGKIGGTLDAGSYRLDVEANGEWSVEIRQPRPTSGETPPVEEECKTSTVLGPYELDGEMRATATHQGGGTFIVRAHDATADGDEVGDLIIHESGTFDGTETFSHDGLTWISLLADGDWTIEIE